MARRPAARRSRPAKSSKKSAPARRSAKRPSAKRKTSAKPSARKKPAGKKQAARSATRKASKPSRRSATKSSGRATTRPTRRSATKAAAPQKPSRLDRERRRLEETVPTPPSSLNMDRHGSAARSGRAELAESRRDHAGMSPAITGGDVDADLENAYFSGDEAPGGDNPTPDQEVVDDIGRALGVEYQDDEELKASDKVTERDKHRWELDPASSEDYKERKK